MTAVRKLAAVPDNPLEHARGEVAKAIVALEIEQKRLDDALADEVQAVRAYDADESKADAAARARVTTQRAERRHVAAQSALTEAQGRLAEIQRAADRAEMDRAISLVASLPSNLAPHIADLVQLDRQASAIVDRIADVLVDAQDAFDIATKIAERLETPSTVQRQISRPTMAWAALLSRIATTRDRARRADGLANGWACVAEDEPGPTDPNRHAFRAAAELVEQMEKAT